MKKRLSFFLLLFVAFLDYMGVGLIIPLFATAPENLYKSIHCIGR